MFGGQRMKIRKTWVLKISHLNVKLSLWLRLRMSFFCLFPKKKIHFTSSIIYKCRLQLHFESLAVCQANPLWPTNEPGWLVNHGEAHGDHVGQAVVDDQAVQAGPLLPHDHHHCQAVHYHGDQQEGEACVDVDVLPWLVNFLRPLQHQNKRRALHKTSIRVWFL